MTPEYLRAIVRGFNNRTLPIRSKQSAPSTHRNQQKVRDLPRSAPTRPLHWRKFLAPEEPKS